MDLSCPREDIAFVEMMNNHTKLVFSNTLAVTQWCNLRLVKGSLADEIVKLKKQTGKDMIVYGSGKLVLALIQLGLVDEYQFWVHPVIILKGNPLFKTLKTRFSLKLIETKTFNQEWCCFFINIKLHT